MQFSLQLRDAWEAAAVIEYIDAFGKSHVRERQARVEDGTKNGLSLKICIEAIRALIKPCRVTIHIDCDYIGNACKRGLPERWRRDGWRRSNGDAPANVEDWKRLFIVGQMHDITFAPYDERRDGELEGILERAAAVKIGLECDDGEKDRAD